MGLFSRLFRRADSRSIENPNVPLSAAVGTWLETMFGGKTDAGITVTPESALTIPAVWQCVSLLCDDFAKLPTHVYRVTDSGGRIVEPTHAAYSLLRRKPNRMLTAGQFRKAMLFNALTRGNGYAWITFNDRFQPSELILLDAARTKPAIVDGELFYVTYVGNEKKVLAAWEVFHLRGMGSDGVTGMSVVEYAANSIGLTLAAERYGSKHFANGARISGVLQYPGRLSPDAAKRLQESFQSRHEGVDNAHKTLLLEENAKFIPTMQTANDAQVVELREFQRKEIASWFKIPPSKLGDPDSVSYNSLEQWNQAYLESALEPWLFAFEEEAYDKLLSERQKQAASHYVETNRDALLRTNLQSRYEAYAQGRQWGWLSVNDVRAKESEEPIGPEGDVYLTPVNMTNSEMFTMENIEAQAEAAAKAQAAKAQPDPADDETDDAPEEDQPQRQVSPLVAEIVSRFASRFIESGRRVVGRDDWQERLARRMEEAFTSLTWSLETAALAVAPSRADALAATTLKFDRDTTASLVEALAEAESREARLAAWTHWTADLWPTHREAFLATLVGVFSHE